MSRSRSVARLAVAAIALAILARPVAAQVTTGTLTGTVKDAQGAVIPGATVAITSDTRGTQLPDVVSNTSGDFTFVNVAPGHLHDSDHDGRLQDVQAERRARQRRRPVCDWRPRDRSRDARRDRQRHRRSVRHPGLERRALVHGQPRGGREPAGREPQLHGPGGALARRHARQQQHPGPPRRRRRSQHHDGRGLGDGHGQQSSAPPDERRVHRRSESAHLGLPGRVRPLERRAGHRDHEEWDQPVPWSGLRRRARLRLVREQQDQQAQRRSQAGPQAA